MGWYCGAERRVDIGTYATWLLREFSCTIVHYVEVPSKRNPPKGGTETMKGACLISLAPLSLNTEGAPFWRVVPPFGGFLSVVQMKFQPHTHPSPSVI